MGVNSLNLWSQLHLILCPLFPHQVAIRRKPGLYILNLLVPSGFLIAIDALSFYLPAENENRAPFKITLLLGYNVFLLMMNKLLPSSGTPLISRHSHTLEKEKIKQPKKQGQAGRQIGE